MTTRQQVIAYVLGAPGSGKTTAVPHLRRLLPGHVVLDWDTFMDPAELLAGTQIRSAPTTWPGYTALVRAVVDQVLPLPLVMLGVATPAELVGWPAGRWVLLDCTDDVRKTRLNGRANPAEAEQALRDAASYRALGLTTIDANQLDPAGVAGAIATLALRAARC